VLIFNNFDNFDNFDNDQNNSEKTTDLAELKESTHKNRKRNILNIETNRLIEPMRPLLLSTKIIFQEDFKHFQEKIKKNLWFYFKTPNNILINNGKLIQDNNGVIIQSDKFNNSTFTNFLSYKCVICRKIPYVPKYKGVILEFTASHITKNINKVKRTLLNKFYETSKIQPEEDPRLGMSAVSIMTTNNLEDIGTIDIVFTKKKIYIAQSISMQKNKNQNDKKRNKFTTLHFVQNRNGNWNEVYTFIINIFYNGHIQVFLKDKNKHIHVIDIPNIAVPYGSKKNLVALYDNIKWSNEPMKINNFNVCIGNYAPYFWMDFDNENTPSTSLASIDKMYRFKKNNSKESNNLSENGNCTDTIVTEANTIIQFPSNSPSKLDSSCILDYNQGSSIKIYSMVGSYF
jgi:hypothetical protein